MSYKLHHRLGKLFTVRRRADKKKIKRYSLIGCVVLVLALLVFAEVIRPNQDASSYTSRLQSSSDPLRHCFEKLSDTTQLDIYGAPDISIDAKQKDVATIKQQITTCRGQLDSFNDQAHRLLNLHFAGYTQTYHQAEVNQRQAYDVIGQSNDVLNQYTDLADFLGQYYDHIQAFSNYFQNIQAVESTPGNPSAATVKVLAQQAADLHKRATAIRALKVSPGFEQTRSATADMFDSMATGFDNAARGYAGYSDYYTNLGLSQIDAAVSTYDSQVINMPFDQLQVSYVPKQVQQLPVKIQNFLAAQSE